MRSDLIFDVGLHLGEDSEFYLKKGFRVVAVEANPANAAAAARRLRSHVEAGRLTIVNKAIARHEGSVPFFVSDLSVWGTIDPRWAERNRRLGSSVSEISVPAVPFSSLLNEYGVPYYMKIDIEGADLLCLEALLESADRPAFVSLESNKTSFDDLVREFCLLQTLGYKKYKVVPQHRVQEQRLPKPAREGQYVDHVFEEGSSGAFGKELPGDWLSLEQALDVHMRLFRKYRTLGDSGTVSSVVREVLKSKPGYFVWKGAELARAIVPRQVLRWIKSRLDPGWYDTHAIRED
ncbi:MAG TPA: FkbM family methyltransferase [Alphaproteobacteria bacterium]|nr:FkbM family methyltransferase [Alphaproteobacteria bacterium]